MGPLINLNEESKTSAPQAIKCNLNEKTKRMVHEIERKMKNMYCMTERLRFERKIEVDGTNSTNESQVMQKKTQVIVWLRKIIIHVRFKW